MAKRSVYVRKENEAQWDALPDKSGWVKAHLEADARAVHAGLPPANTVEIVGTALPAEPYYDARLGRMVNP